ncbi:MAG: hypothetical protein MRT15_04375 [archaeon YNP-LCB-003-016]|uniref:hypothetical protein n=1 Tax=Candidatus Culexarchaeum yellowstonense TaxID=2928963 RepID=UPI0026F13695|nr:hypothetical protein [Candidatus Culexarchaeum yellowstonense]MCR6691605.1 hypothetical protein [Candidatus Culexarchaeum yellowstonense]
MSNSRGISAIMVSIILLAVSIGMAVAYASTMMGWFGSAMNIVKIDASDSKIILNPSTNQARIQIVLRNMGTTTIKVSSISIDTEGQKAIVNFTSNNAVIYLQDQTPSNGNVYGSTKDVTISNNQLLIPQGCTATIYFEITSSTQLWKLGNVYRALAFYDGGIFDFKISAVY